MTGKIKLIGLDEVKKQFAKLDTAIQIKLGRQALSGAANVIAAEIRRTAPRSGITDGLSKEDKKSVPKPLARSVVRSIKRRRDRRGFYGRVGIHKSVWYAHFIEYGTSPHRIPNKTVGRGRNKQENKGFVAFGGGVFRSVNHPGIAANPFVRRALETKKQAAIDEMTKRLKAGIAAHWGR